eukprot:XP_011437527.1 PREDICTED: uncharacterized protein LOC105335385 [Crassostrea gigas]
MASYTTDSIREISGEHMLRGNTNRINRILPPCEYTVSTDLQRLSTFSKLTDHDVTHKISAVRLAASGCVYNADEGYIECTGCAKVSMLNNVPQINSVNDIKTYHQKPCLLVLEYIEKQEKEIREGMINLHELKRFHRHSHENEMPSYDELVRRYGIDQRLIPSD